jgi:hypothetical protein
MKTLECELCGTVIKPGDDGLKYNNMYFCSQKCLDKHVNWDTYPIEPIDFERDGEEDEDEIVNDYDIQMGHAND